MSDTVDIPSRESLPEVVATLSQPIFTQAFTHRSLRAQSVPRHETNERLEFLGDAVLELIVSEYLITTYPKRDEGTLTRYRAAIVRTESLGFVAGKLQLGAHLQLSAGEPMLQHEVSLSVLADTFEAVVGAIYTDKGYDATQAFIATYLLPHLSEFITSEDAKDAKTLLQEKVQALGLTTPSYSVIHEEGPDHDKTFTIAVEIENHPPYTGIGPSKQKAEQAAASEALKQAFPGEKNLI